MNRRRMMMLTKPSVKYKYGLQSSGFWYPSAFNFGITWAEVDKVVVVADRMVNTSTVTDGGGQMLLCGVGQKAPWIGFQSGEFKTNGLSNVSFNLTAEEYNDKSIELHDYIVKFTANSTVEITNIWDNKWDRGIRYFKFEFWKSNKLLKRFIPDPTNSDRLYDTVNSEYITASILGQYQLQEIK